MPELQAGQKHRTVKNQQGELAFPKCQVYNLQNGSITKNKDKKMRKETNSRWVKWEKIEKDVSSIVGTYKTQQDGNYLDKVM